jgi:hypothetical protein
MNSEPYRRVSRQIVAEFSLALHTTSGSAKGLHYGEGQGRRDYRGREHRSFASLYRVLGAAALIIATVASALANF